MYKVVDVVYKCCVIVCVSNNVMLLMYSVFNLMCIIFTFCKKRYNIKMAILLNVQNYIDILLLCIERKRQ